MSRAWLAYDPDAPAISRKIMLKDSPLLEKQLGEGISGLKSHVDRPIYAPSTYQCSDHKR